MACQNGRTDDAKGLFSTRAGTDSRAIRKEMIDINHPLSLSKPCQLLSLNRSSYYYQPADMSAEELGLMEHIDRIYLEYPFYGSRRIVDELETQGVIANRKKVQRLMRVMGIMALFPGKKTSQPNNGHKTYPYWLRGLPINRANQVWSTDITCIPIIPMAKGLVYLVAVIDWFSRKVLSWRLSNTMDVRVLC